MKRYRQDKELTIYQEEILNQNKPIDLKKEEGEKTYFPDLLTPYQRALLRGETPEEIKFFKDEEKNEEKRNKPLHSPMLLCYIASILGSAGLITPSVIVAKAKPICQNLTSIAQNERAK